MPTPDALDTMRVLNSEIEDDIKRKQTAKWKQQLEGITYNTNSSRLRKLICGLNNRYNDKTDTVEAILTHAQRNIPTDTQQANILSTHYTNICKLPHRYEDRTILKGLHSITLDTNMTPPCTPTMTLHAIRKTKNTSATVPDGISYLQLTNLGPHAIRTLTDILNLSLTTNSIPNIWILAHSEAQQILHRTSLLQTHIPSFATLLKC